MYGQRRISTEEITQEFRGGYPYLRKETVVYYRKEMTEKARAVIAGEIDIPCPDDGYFLDESTELCAYACTLLRMPDAGMDKDAMKLEDIRAFQYGMEHNIGAVWDIIGCPEASTIVMGGYDGVDGSDLYRWIIGRCDDAEKWRRAKHAGMLYLMEVKHKECSSRSDFEKFCCGFLTDCQDLVTAKDVSTCTGMPLEDVLRTAAAIEKNPFY